jgi:RNA polymerase sigma factor (sigma-70 family)
LYLQFRVAAALGGQTVWINMNPPMPTDAELLARLQAGDDSAWGQIYEVHREGLWRTARRVLRVGVDGSLRGLSPDDVVLDTMTEIMKKGVTSVTNLRSFLVRSVRNRAIDMIRADSTANRKAPLLIEDDVASAEERALLAVLGEKVRECMEVLTPQEYTALTERVIKGRKAVEVARDMGISGTRVSQLVKAGCDRLRPLIAGELDDISSDSEGGGA